MTYRNKNLLQWAKRCPYCMRCHRGNTGTIVAAHSNQLRDGKGRGVKAPDFMVAYLCNDCHMEIDQGKDMTKAERFEAWDDAWRRTIAWLFNHGVLDVKVCR